MTLQELRERLVAMSRWVHKVRCLPGWHGVERKSYVSEGRYVSALIVQDICKHCGRIHAGTSIPWSKP